LEPQDIQDRIQAWLEQQFLVSFSEDVNSDTDLFEAGVIDSFGQVELVSFLEKTFSIHFTDEELMSPEMAKLSSMTTIVNSKLS
jgi:acyl carrier protein